MRSLEPNITVTDALRYKDLAEALARRIEEITVSIGWRSRISNSNACAHGRNT